MTDPSAQVLKRRFRRRTLRVRVDYVVAGAMRCEWATTLGAGGMFVETEDAPAVGTRLKVRFRLPSGANTHEIEGRVAWAMSPEGIDGSPAPSPGMGIEFADSVASAALARELEREPEATS
jgi:uncharacterized protein (TIGR02266 family)